MLLPVRSFQYCPVRLEGEYGLSGIHCGVPCLVGAGGIEKIVELPLTEEEKEALNRSARVLLKHTGLADEIASGLNPEG